MHLDLPPLAVEDLGEVALHQLAIAAPDRVGPPVGSGTTAVGGRDDAAEALLLPTEAMEVLRLIAGIAQQVSQTLMRQSVPDRRASFAEIGLGTPVNRKAQDQMVGRIPDG